MIFWKFTGDELSKTEKDGLPSAFPLTCSILLAKIAAYDISVQNVGTKATIKEIYNAFAKRGPNFTLNGVLQTKRRMTHSCVRIMHYFVFFGRMITTNWVGVVRGLFFPG